jgi:heat shock protein HslJ
MIHPFHRKWHALRLFRIGAAAALAGLPLLSCSDGVTGPSDVMGGLWKLQSMRLAGATSSFVPSDPSRFTVEFKSDGAIGLRADCNSCGGTYSLSGNRLTVPGMACTLALCATPNGGEFANLIEGASTLDKNGDDTLSVSSADGAMTLIR